MFCLQNFFKTKLKKKLPERRINSKYINSFNLAFFYIRDCKIKKQILILANNEEIESWWVQRCNTMAIGYVQFELKEKNKKVPFL